MSNKTYLCTLRPMGKFFFGGEKTFGDASEPQQSNYLVRSNPFPQQTTLLGMIRYELLRQKGYLPINPSNKKNVDELIGEESFKIVGNKDFGKIVELSPAFIKNSGENYLFAPRDRVYSEKHGLENFTHLISSEKAFRFENSLKAVKQIEIQQFDHKAHYLDHFVKASNFTDSLRFDKIFIDDSQIGIKKGSKNRDDKGFYKQFFYKMQEGFAFAFYLKMKEAIAETQNQIVFMGADKSAFILNIEEESSFFDALAAPKLGNKITLLSDAYAEQSIYDSCDFALTDTTTFRNIETTTAQNNYAKSYTKNKRVLNLLKRGSVLFVKDLTNVQKALDNEHFRQIGYNIYKID